ncbi:MAG TPA: hypothetical protein VGF55_20970 [Gemmataceae bacterium]|jgi:hypothetical protein
MATERRVVNNRVFLLGLDDLYRGAMKRHERDKLLRCSAETAAGPFATTTGPSTGTPRTGRW